VPITTGPSRSWSYGSCINYLCNQCLSPRGHHDHVRMVVILTTCTISAYLHYGCEFESCSWPGVLNTTLCDKSLSVTCGRSVVFSRYPVLLLPPPIKLTVKYNLNIYMYIIFSGQHQEVNLYFKHHNPPLPLNSYNLPVQMYERMSHAKYWLPKCYYSYNCFYNFWFS
jgi:hypothetical protein